MRKIAGLSLVIVVQFFQLSDKFERLKKNPDSAPFVDPAGYRRYLERAAVRLRRTLEPDSH